MIVPKTINILLSSTSYKILIFSFTVIIISEIKSWLSGMFLDFSRDLKIQELGANNCF